MARHGCLEVYAVRNICQKRYFAEGVPALDLVNRALVSLGLRLEYANLALKQYPEKVRCVTLVGKELVLAEVDVSHSLDAMQLIVLQRREDGNLAKLRKQLWSYCFDDLVLDGLRLVTHGLIGSVAFQSVAKY